MNRGQWPLLLIWFPYTEGRQGRERREGKRLWAWVFPVRSGVAFPEEQRLCLKAQVQMPESGFSKGTGNGKRNPLFETVGSNNFKTLPESNKTYYGLTLIHGPLVSGSPNTTGKFYCSEKHQWNSPLLFRVLISVFVSPILSFICHPVSCCLWKMRTLKM